MDKHKENKTSMETRKERLIIGSRKENAMNSTRDVRFEEIL